MEAINLYFLSLLVSIFIAFYFRFLAKRNSKFPPGATGFPIIGETLHLVSSGPEKFIRQRMEKHSEEIFTTALLGEKVAVVCGPEGNKFLLYSANDCLVPWLPPSLAKFIVWACPGGGSAKQMIAKGRRFIHEMIRSGNAKKDYIPVMDSMARQHLNVEWEPYEEVKVHPLANKFALSLACRLLLGLVDPIQVQKFADTFSKTMSGIYSMPINLPGTTYNRALKEIKNLKRQLLSIIEERRNSLSGATLENHWRDGGNLDMLSRMLLDQNAKTKPDLEIAFNLVSLMIPSHESTSAATTFVLKYVAELPHIHDKVYKEISEIAKYKAPEELLNWEDIQKMEYSWHVISESQRLTPPGLGTFREVLTDLNFAGYTIPKGWKMLWSPFTTNKDPRYFPDPETFDPTRHEGNGPVPGTHLPFSMGPRKCPGQEYSKFVILIYMYNVLRKFKLEKLIPDEKVVYHGGPAPANGLPMRLHPRTKL